MAESNATKFALIRKDIADIYKDLVNFVGKMEFYSEIKRLDNRISPVEKISYGAVSLVLIAVFGALISLVIRK